MIIVIAIIGAILGIILFRSIGKYLHSFVDWVKLIMSIILLVGAFYALIFGFGIPSGGYEESKLIESYEVVSFILDGEEIYAIDTDKCTVFVKAKTITGEGEVTYIEIKQLECDTYEIVQEEDCKVPRIEIYLKTGKGSIWTLPVEEDVEHYKIYVPVGTVYSDN